MSRGKNLWKTVFHFKDSCFKKQQKNNNRQTSINLCKVNGINDWPLGRIVRDFNFKKLPKLFYKSVFKKLCKFLIRVYIWYLKSSDQSSSAFWEYFLKKKWGLIHQGVVGSIFGQGAYKKQTVKWNDISLSLSPALPLSLPPPLLSPSSPARPPSLPLKSISKTC